jgi:hypothetical protein
MWAAIAIYDGREDNALFRRDEGRASGHVVPSAAVSSWPARCCCSATTRFTGRAIPAPRSPVRSTSTAATASAPPRSQWDPETLEEEPYDFAAVNAAVIPD